MKMTQPVWKLIANLGDVNPIDHGGYFIYRDETRNYNEEAELLEVIDEDSEEPKWIVRRFTLDQCTLIDGILSDNIFHPEHPAWFAAPESMKALRPQDTTYLSSVARYSDISLDELQANLCSPNPVERAMAYRMIGDYHGWENFDSYPLVITDRSEIEARYSQASSK